MTSWMAREIPASLRKHICKFDLFHAAYDKDNSYFLQILMKIFIHMNICKFENQLIKVVQFLE